MVRQNALRLALATVAALGCGGAAGTDGYGTGPSNNNPPPQNPPATPPAANTVMIANDAFNPNAVTVSPGTTVTWKWAACTNNGDGYGGYGGSTCPTHNVTFDDGSNQASQTQDNGEYARTFASPGTYNYHCTIHGQAMSGQIVVK